MSNSQGITLHPRLEKARWGLTEPNLEAPRRSQDYQLEGMRAFAASLERRPRQGS